MKDKTIEKKIVGTTWSEVMENLDKCTNKVGTIGGKNPSESDSSSDKT